MALTKANSPGRRRAAGVPRKELDEAFSELDRNGDEVLSREEISTAVLEYFTSEEPDAPGNWLFGSA
ncbi:hypothetical protein ACFTWH_15175 [Streptomyces sp. NPDC057011]|uniref:hypothetical protein n=1 Tax=unclassified Streptomyces TaxID=2593676 RepID=UPI00363A21FF